MTMQPACHANETAGRHGDISMAVESLQHGAFDF